jgi:clan AA aspartic protease (TIGR02281 family)
MKFLPLILLLMLATYGIGWMHGASTIKNKMATSSAQIEQQSDIVPTSTQEQNPLQQVPVKKVQRILFYGQYAIERNVDGHYYMPGKINGEPVKFLVDTGASLSVVSYDVAVKAGITECRKAEFQTAMGVDRDVCVVTISRLDFGSFTLNDIEIGVSKNLIGDALLGMNVLKHLKIVQSGDTLLLENELQ